ncbi:hypothetical protein Z950_2314 [Sulfitobacter mediterraneus KCTC 32188]|nr:hypothetical protein Z950_2314 [Sulfitobacter mediterraneus KCTC 32188]
MTENAQVFWLAAKKNAAKPEPNLPPCVIVGDPGPAPRF